MRIQFAASLLLAAIFAGCLGGETTAPTKPSASGNDTLPDFKPVEASKEQDLPTTLEAPPLWKQGEWWKVRLTDHFIGNSYETIRVVAGIEGDNYLVGMPADQFSDDMMVLHMPGFGQVSREALSYDTHNAPFQPLRFPLRVGDSWETQWEGAGLATATVKAVTATTADIQIQAANMQANLTYDTKIREISKFVGDRYASYEVLDHGYNYTGMITVPHMFKLVFQNFRIGPVLNGGLQPAVITETVMVDSTYDRTSFGLLFVGLCTEVALCQGGVTQPNAGGYYEETATGPGGKQFKLTVMPTDAPIAVQTFFMDKPGGEWTFQHIAGGPGLLGAEGIAYHMYDVMMPSGEVMASLGEHKHGGAVDT